MLRSTLILLQCMENSAETYRFPRSALTRIRANSDAGFQYPALAFAKELRDSGIAASIGTVGDVLDNALMESTIGLFKTEAIDRHRATWRDRVDVERATGTRVRWFNYDRLHSSIGYVPPVAFELHYVTPKNVVFKSEAA
jgi:transposase InsO family protein